MTDRLDRRGVLRLLSLSALAVAAAPALAACGSTDSPGATGVGADVQLVSSDVARAAGDPGAVPGAVAALHRLGGGVLASVGAEPGNVAVSPYSIGVALALTLNGAKGATLDQMTALFAPADVDAINGGLDALTADVDALAGPQKRGDGTTATVALSSANALFGQRGEAWEQPFLDTLARSYGAGLQTVDFGGDVDGAVHAIDGWTADHTEGRITDIVTTDSVTPDTRLVLVNALYLKAPWEDPFDKDATQDGDFTRADGTTVTASLMHGEPGYAPYREGDGWVSTSMAYAGNGLAMTVVLPDAGRLDDIAADVEAGRVASFLASDDDGTEVALTLPRWTFRTRTPLVAALQKLGMVDAFESGRADFGGITTQESLYVGAVLHQVFIAVDEDGTEAAAATAVVAMPSSARLGGPKEVVVDRPFFFVIHDVAHGAPLFVGRVDDPTAT